LEQLHVLPNVSYMAKVRNTDEEDKNWGGEEEHAAAEHGGGEHEGGHGLPSSTTPDSTAH
ncbi:hypothetical protein, partial [Klebsiella aerogenes]|uniref:hypothetical protein n=1 Tax=Klebsiella aerogenes TaxID=548 RepID=UPI001CC7D834